MTSISPSNLRGIAAMIIAAAAFVANDSCMKLAMADLPPLLRDEPALTRALGEPDARLAVVEVARPISIAALAALSQRRPLVVACPTGTRMSCWPCRIRSGVRRLSAYEIGDRWLAR